MVNQEAGLQICFSHTGITDQRMQRAMGDWNSLGEEMTDGGYPEPHDECRCHSLSGSIETAVSSSRDQSKAKKYSCHHKGGLSCNIKNTTGLKNLNTSFLLLVGFVKCFNVCYVGWIYIYIFSFGNLFLSAGDSLVLNTSCQEAQ